MSDRIDLSKPRFDQSTYLGRARHFLATTDPRLVLASNEQLDAYKALVDAYRAGKEPAGTTADEVWEAKRFVDGAFHPDTGEKLFLPGRMSFQVPGNMTVMGLMLTFYKRTPHVVAMQVLNQTFNAGVNYTNRNASAETSPLQLGVSYVVGTTTAVSVALGFNKFVARFPALSAGFVGRLSPLVAVAMANIVNISSMRSSELMNGIAVQDEDGNKLGESQIAARSAISQVIASRIAMAVPACVIPPLLVSRAEQTALVRRVPFLTVPLMIGLVGLNLTLSTPLCCAIFPQMSSLHVDKLEPRFHGLKSIKNGDPIERVFFNKGL